MSTFYIKFLKLNKALFKRLHNYFEYQIVKKEHSSFRTNKLIKELKCKELSKSQINEIKDYYKSFGFKNINTDWHRIYTHISGKFYKEYLPVEFFHNVIEPHLNLKTMYPALSDKNLLDTLFTKARQPETIIKNINGFFFHGDGTHLSEFSDVVSRCKEFTNLIIKPSIDSGGGKNIITFQINENHTSYKGLTIDEVINLYNKDFIIQTYFEQDEDMSRLNESSVNTLRIQTLFLDNSVEILASIVRIGAKGAPVDNASLGGCFCNINNEGYLDKKGYYIDATPVYNTDNGVKFEGYKIPNYKNILKEVKNLHLQIPYFKIIAWDIAIDKEGKAVLIEFNPFIQMIHHQFTVGPLLGKHTDKILNECKINMFIS